jgi:bifunctional ADP-heptose synthase (sugar kinase/adenylyltransferase)
VTELQERLTNIVRAFSQQKLVIIGDAIADKFLYGSISRVSREAPVFILRHEQTETVPGGAANCAINLASLGANVSLVSVVGNDQAAERLKRAGVDTNGPLTSTTYRQNKAKFCRPGLLAVSVIRIDYKMFRFQIRKCAQRLLKN